MIVAVRLRRVNKVFCQSDRHSVLTLIEVGALQLQVIAANNPAVTNQPFRVVNIGADALIKMRSIDINDVELAAWKLRENFARVANQIIHHVKNIGRANVVQKKFKHFVVFSSFVHRSVMERGFRSFIEIWPPLIDTGYRRSTGPRANFKDTNEALSLQLGYCPYERDKIPMTHRGTLRGAHCRPEVRLTGQQCINQLGLGHTVKVQEAALSPCRGIILMMTIQELRWLCQNLKTRCKIQQPIE